MALSSGPAERNKEYILAVLQQQIGLRQHDTCLKILEIASGTGEHCAHFAGALGNVIYQPTEPDIKMMDSIIAWSSNIPSGVVRFPIAFDITESDITGKLPDEFLAHQTNIIICINMIHISPFACTDYLFRVAGDCLQQDGFVITYGPYRVNGSMVDSNIAFDASLKSRNPEWGVRNLEDVEAIAANYKFRLSDRIGMPANNFCLIFRRFEL